MKGNVSNNVVFTEDGVVVYPSGSFLVRHNTTTRSQEAFPVSEKGTSGITAMALSGNRRYIAVAETCADPRDGCVITIFNTKTMSKRRIIQTGADLPPGAGGIRSLSFSSDDSMILALAGQPDCVLAIVSVEKARVVARVSGASSNGTGAPAASVRLHGASFSPLHTNKLVAWGANGLAYFAVEDAPDGSAASLGGMTQVITPIPHSAEFVEWVTPHISSLSSPDFSPDATTGSVGGFGATASGSGLVPPPSPMATQSSFRGSPGPAASPGGTVSPNSSFVADGIIFTAHAWLADKDYNVVATRGGDLLLFQRETFIRVLPCSPADGRAIDVLYPTIRGFLSAGEAGFVRIFENAPPPEEGEAGSGRAASARSGRRSGSRSGRRSAGAGAGAGDGGVEDLGPFLCVRSLQATVAGLESEDRIRSLNVSPNGDSAVFSLAGTQLLVLDVANANVKDESTAFTPVGPPSHAPPVGLSCAPGGPSDLCAVVSMSVAVRKPVVASVGTDGSVRLWNFIERSAEIVKYYPEGATCVGIHPSGLLAAVGFQDRLRFMTVTLDDLREIRQYPIKGESYLRGGRGSDYV